MKQHYFICVLYFLCISGCGDSQLSSSDAEQTKDWKLVWSDEFDRPGLPDSTKWTYETGFIRNNEAQYYTFARPENARVESGMLIIESRKEQYQDAGYTSASLNTLGKADWTYGRFEVRAKLPTGNGMWPALWMLGVNRKEVGWPACGELDIMENVGFDPDVIHANIHTEKYNHVKKTNKGNKITVAKPYEDFHVYAMEWFPDHIDFFVDDTRYFTFNNEGSGWQAASIRPSTPTKTEALPTTSASFRRCCGTE